MSDGRVVIIDQLNLFFRNYIVNPSLSSNGYPIGGLKGCIQSIQKIIRETKPDKLIICWDGEGGSAKRKILKKDYKEGRKPIRLNRDVRNMSEKDEADNKAWQQTRLIDYFNHMPIIQYMFKGTEADDIIAYITQLPSMRNWEKIIVSSDKDFYQLLTNKTILYRPIQKEIMNTPAIVEKFGIHPNNFAIARAMVGDKSDNIEGVGSVGLKTVCKRFPFLRDDATATFDMILGHCRQQLENKKLRVYENVLTKEDVLRRNYDMMQLYAPMVSIEAKKYIRQSLQEADMSFNKTEVIKMMMQDGFGEINFIELFQHFNKMSMDAL